MHQMHIVGHCPRRDALLKRREDKLRPQEEKKRGREEAPCGEDVHGEVHQVQGDGVLALQRWT